MRLVRKLGRRREVEVNWVPERGKGSHGTLYYGARFTVVQNLNNESQEGLLAQYAGPTRPEARRLAQGEGVTTMRNLAYPATLTPDREAGGFTVTFRDLPEAVTQGEDRLDALDQAADCLEEAVAGRILRGDEIPAPSKTRARQAMVPVRPLMATKAALY